MHNWIIRKFAMGACIHAWRISVARCPDTYTCSFLHVDTEQCTFACNFLPTCKSRPQVWFFLCYTSLHRAIGIYNSIVCAICILWTHVDHSYWQFKALKCMSTKFQLSIYCNPCWLNWLLRHYPFTASAYRPV